MNADNNELTVFFSEDIDIDANWSEEDFDIFIEGPNAPYYLTWELEETSRRELLTTRNYMKFKIDI